MTTIDELLSTARIVKDFAKCIMIKLVGVAQDIYDFIMCESVAKGEIRRKHQERDCVFAKQLLRRKKRIHAVENLWEERRASRRS